MEILDLTKSAFESAVVSAGYPKFRARQIIKWVYHKSVYSFVDMSDLSKDDRTAFSSMFSITPIEEPVVHGSDDGTKKLTFTLDDGAVIESVIIPEETRNTLCISTQAGCPLKCAFCRTGTLGFKRNLTVREITGQVIRAEQLLEKTGEHLNNIVYMGMGEPLDNFDNFIKAVGIFSELDGLAISRRRQTVSTSGIASKIEKLGKIDLGIQLAISLHAVDDELRSELIPMNKAYNIASIIDAVKKFPIDTRKKVMFEYLVIKNKNDSLDAAKKLVKLLNGIQAKVNLIFFNPYPGTTYQRPEVEDMLRFKDYLNEKSVICTIRESKGLDISAACGQLKEKEANGNS